MQRKHVLWDDVRGLHGVRSLAQLAERRWHLDLNFVASDGRVIEGPVPAAEGRLRLVRDLRQRALTRGVLRFNALLSRPVWAETVRVPYRGMRLEEVAAPVVLETHRLGWVTVGMYVVGDEPPTKEMLGALSLTAEQMELALALLRRLDDRDIELLSDLVTSVAREIVEFQSQVAGGERRRDQMPEYQARRSYEHLIGKSRPMQQLYRLLDTVVDSDATILIQGENGTGKELIARAVHQHSRRSVKPFVMQNCSAFSDKLLDSELFGHAKDAFVGAHGDKEGLLEFAKGGTLFLDEISGMSLALQLKLLRVLQDGVFSRMGDPRVQQSEVRVMAATNRDLLPLIQSGAFREDLYYRISVVHIAAPPLRERVEDIPMLVEHFLRVHSHPGEHPGEGEKKLTRGCMEQLMAYIWPGNVRELENEIERLVVLSGSQQLIGEELLSTRIAQSAHRRPPTKAQHPHSLIDAVETLERNMISDVLRQHRWNKTRAAHDLKISRRNLIRKVHKYELEQRGSA